MQINSIKIKDKEFIKAVFATPTTEVLIASFDKKKDKREDLEKFVKEIEKGSYGCHVDMETEKIICKKEGATDGMQRQGL